MKNSLVSLLVISGIVLCGCDNSTTDGGDAGTLSSASHAPEEEQNSEEQNSTVDLSGVWLHSNSANGTPGLEARISGSVIEVKWKIDGAPGSGIYWLGTFDPIFPVKGSSTFTSVRDKIGTESELMSSSDDSKDFTYENRVLRFPVTIQGDTFVAEMKKDRDFEPEEKVSSTGNDYSFQNGVLDTPELSVKIKESHVIPVGGPGNESGGAPVIAFYYDITNKGNGKVTPTDFIGHFEAVQDNDRNKINKLKVAPHPDPATMNDQLAEIKPGGTLAGAVGFELTDDTTPVELIATTPGSTEIGRQTYSVQ